MSLFNFNPSSFLGSGAFALDPSKFDFSNINVPSTTPDPLDIVAPEPVQPEQTGMLSPEPQYSQALLDAQEGLLGVDFSDSFNVNPIQGLDLNVSEEPAPEPVNVIPQPVQSNPVIPQQLTPVIGDSSLASGFDISQSSIVNMFNQDVTNRNLLEPLLEDYDKFQVSQGDRGLIEGDIAKDLMSFVTTDDFNNLVNQYSQLRVGEQTGNQTVQQMASREVLDALGIPNLFETKDDKGRSSVYQFNTDTNEFDLVRQYGGTDAVGEFVEAAAPALLVTAATAGLGGALAGSLGVGGSAVGTGVTNALVNAGLQQALTGDIDPAQALLAGFNAGLETYTEAANTAQEVASNLQNIAETGNAGERAIAATQLASATQKASEMNATLDVLNNVSNVIKGVQAIENDNFLQGFDLLGTVAGTPTFNSLVTDGLQGVVPDEFMDDAVKATVAGADALLRGEDAGGVLQATANNFLITRYATPESMSENFGLSGEGWDVATANVMADMTKKALQGGNREEIFGKGLEAFISNIPESDRKTPDYLKQVEEWWHKNVEDPLEKYWQDIEPYREQMEQAAEYLLTQAEGVLAPVYEGFRAMEEGGEVLFQQLGDAAQDLVDPMYRGLRNLEESGERAWQNFWGDGNFEFPDWEFPEMPDIDLPDLPDLPDVDLPDLPDAPDLPDTPDIDLPSVDLPEPPEIDVPDLFADSTQQQQEQEEYGNIIGYDDMGMPIYDNTIEILANQLLTNQN